MIYLRLTSRSLQLCEDAYSLILFEDENVPRFHQVMFKVECNNMVHRVHKTKGFAVTARNVEEYHPDIANLELNANLRYCEVGAGLGEFVLYVAEKVNERPIVIDPVDYNKLKRLLGSAYQLKLKDRHKVIIESMIERCDDYLKQEKVKVYNFTLEEALEKCPELKHSMDVVVENFGPAYYAEHAQVTKLEKMLLKPEGLLLQRSVDSSLLENNKYL
jgi:hypothetical protein